MKVKDYENCAIVKIDMYDEIVKILEKLVEQTTASPEVSDICLRVDRNKNIHNLYVFTVNHNDHKLQVELTIGEAFEECCKAESGAGKAIQSLLANKIEKELLEKDK